jgi:hypothetical protein
MKCSICDNDPALYQAGQMFFCKIHRPDAVEEMKRLTDKYLAKRSVREYEYKKATEQI